MRDVSDKVVDINGGPVIGAGRPSESLIKQLEWLLEAAMSGEVTGIAYALTYRDQTVSFGIDGIVLNYSTIGALEAAKARVTESMK